MKRLGTKQAAELLGVEINAKPVDLNKKWKQLAREHHPDLHPGDITKETRFKILNAAYQTLADLREGTRAAKAIEEEILDDEFNNWLELLPKKRRDQVLKDLREFLENE